MDKQGNQKRNNGKRGCPFCKRENSGHFPVGCPELVCHSCGEKGHMQDVCPDPLCHWCGECGHKQAECSRRRKRRASSEGEGSESVAAGGAPSAAKTDPAVLTAECPGRENVGAATSSRGPGSNGNDWSYMGKGSNGNNSGGSYAGAVTGGLQSLIQ